jgi:hypothetical protein
MIILHIIIFLLINKAYHKIFRILLNILSTIKVISILSNTITRNKGIVGLTIKDDECPICYEMIKNVNFVVTKCNHKFCMPCLLKVFQQNNTCPCCRSELIADSQYRKLHYEEEEEEEGIEAEIDNFVNNMFSEEMDLNNLNDNEPRYNEGPQATNNQIMEAFENEGYALLDAVMLLTERYAIEENKNTNAYYYKVQYGFDNIVNSLDSQIQVTEVVDPALPD